MYGHALNAYLDELTELPGQLDALLQARDWAGTARLLHTLKGLSATVGANDMADVARHAESLVKAADAAFVPGALYTTLCAAVTRTQAHLRTVAEAFSATPPNAPAPHSPPAEDTLVADLQHLCALLLASDMQALEVHARLHQTYAATSGPALAPLALSIGAFDFAQAVVQCEALIRQFSPSN